MRIVFIILMFIIGACFGSFFCCQARRLHIKETKKATKKLPARSVCLKCGYKLKWYDNIPIISWLILKGKCRKCHKKIGIGEIISEFSIGLAFSLLAIGAILNGLTLESFFSESVITYFMLAAFVILTLSLLFLAVYDGLYGELPVLYLTISIICAIIIAILNPLGIFSSSGFSWGYIADLIIATIILGGTYLVLYLISKGKWVGDGDWLLGAAIGLTLGKPWLSLLTLFLSNLLACLVMLPFTKGNNSKIPFGPFLIAAFIIVYSFAPMCDIINLW